MGSMAGITDMRKKTRQLSKGKWWHRLFGHAPLRLAGHGHHVLYFICTEGGCYGFVTIITRDDLSERLRLLR